MSNNRINCGIFTQWVSTEYKTGLMMHKLKCMRQQYKSHKNNSEQKNARHRQHSIYDSIYIKQKKKTGKNQLCARCQDSVYSYRKGICKGFWVLLMFWFLIWMMTLQAGSVCENSLSSMLVICTFFFFFYLFFGCAYSMGKFLGQG